MAEPGELHEVLPVDTCRNFKPKKWMPPRTKRGKHIYIGIFADEIEAAKARDRKAYELHGEYAYLNFPEDFAKE